MGKNFKNNLKQKLKSKKGLSAIDLVIGALASIILFAGFLDFIIISNRKEAMSTTMTYLSRTMSNQGCLANQSSKCLTSDGRAVYDESYIKSKKFTTSSELYGQVLEIMRSQGMTESDFEVFIDGKPLGNDTTTRIFDFGEKIDIRINIRYKWANLSNFMPIDLNYKEEYSHQKVVSTYKVRGEGSDSGFEYGK